MSHPSISYGDDVGKGTASSSMGLLSRQSRCLLLRQSSTSSAVHTHLTRNHAPNAARSFRKRIRRCWVLLLDNRLTSRFTPELKISQRGFSLPRSPCMIHLAGTNRGRQQRLILSSPTLLVFAQGIGAAHLLYSNAIHGPEFEMASTACRTGHCPPCGVACTSLDHATAGISSTSASPPRTYQHLLAPAKVDFRESMPFKATS